MTDDSDHTDTFQTPPAARPDRFKTPAVVLGVLAALLWGYTAFGAAQNHTEIEDIANNIFRDASAVQISQVSDQALVEIIPWIAGSTAATVLMFLFIGLALIARADA